MSLKIKLIENEDGTYTPHLDLDLSLNGVFGFPLLELPKARSLEDEAAVEFMAYIKESLIEDLEEAGYPKALIIMLKALPVEVIWDLLKRVWSFILAQYAVLSGQVDFGEEDTNE